MAAMMGGSMGGVALEASVAERAALAVLDDFTDTFNLENDGFGGGTTAEIAPQKEVPPKALQVDISPKSSPVLENTSGVAVGVEGPGGAAPPSGVGPSPTFSAMVSALPPPLRTGLPGSVGRPRVHAKAANGDGSGASSSGIPEDLICPISHELMIDPVLAADGHAYERLHIEEWLTRQLTSPLTGEPLLNAQLLPCHALRKMAAAYKAAR